MSRRSVIVGGASALAAPALVAPASSAPPPAVCGPDPDAELRRRTTEARRCLAAYRRAEAACDRLSEAVDRHPEMPRPMPDTNAARDRWYAVADRLGFNAALARWERRYALYETALGVAFAIPAGTVAGVHGKLRLAVTAVKRDRDAGFDDVDCRYLDSTLADLGLLVARRAD